MVKKTTGYDKADSPPGIEIHECHMVRGIDEAAGLIESLHFQESSSALCFEVISLYSSKGRGTEMSQYMKGFGEIPLIGEKMGSSRLGV